jgi:hypothetical protein
VYEEGLTDGSTDGSNIRLGFAKGGRVRNGKLNTYAPSCWENCAIATSRCESISLIRNAYFGRDSPFPVGMSSSLN